MIIKSYNDFAMTSNSALLKTFFERTFKPMTLSQADTVKKHIIKNYAVVFSGHQPLLQADTCIEYKHFENSGILFGESTIFADKNNPVLFKLLSKLKVSTLVFAHSPEFCYLSLDEVLNLIEHYKKHTLKQIVVVISIFMMRFNRLGSDIESLEIYLNGKCVDNSIVICS